MNIPIAAVTALGVAACVTGCGSNGSDAAGAEAVSAPPAVEGPMDSVAPQDVAPTSAAPRAGITSDGAVRTELTMPLNSTLPLGAQTDSEPVKVPVTYESVACKAVWPGLDMDWDKMEAVDAVAGPGSQLCIVRLVVNNTSTYPISFISAGDLELKASNRSQCSEWDGAFSAGGFANSEGVGYAGDSDYVQPGSTEYDFTMFEIPASATPDVLMVWDWIPVGQEVQTYSSPSNMDVD